MAPALSPHCLSVPKPSPPPRVLPAHGKSSAKSTGQAHPFPPVPSPIPLGGHLKWGSTLPHSPRHQGSVLLFPLTVRHCKARCTPLPSWSWTPQAAFSRKRPCRSFPPSCHPKAKPGPSLPESSGHPTDDSLTISPVPLNPCFMREKSMWNSLAACCLIDMIGLGKSYYGCGWEISIHHTTHPIPKPGGPSRQNQT